MRIVAILDSPSLKPRKQPHSADFPSGRWISVSCRVDHILPRENGSVTSRFITSSMRDAQASKNTILIFNGLAAVFSLNPRGSSR